MIGSTNLWISGQPRMLPKLNVRRAVFVLGKIDEILAWDKDRERERDTRFVELGRYLSEVRSGQYWRLDRLKSFDEFLERRFPDSRRKAYYLMAIHEHLTRIPKQQLKEMGWTKATELAKVARREGERFDCETWMHKVWFQAVRGADCSGRHMFTSGDIVYIGDILAQENNRMATGRTRSHKHFRLDPVKIKRAQRVLRAGT